MSIGLIAVLAAAIAIPVSCGFWSRCILREEEPMLNEEVITFRLCRTWRSRRDRLQIWQSWLSVEVATDDPYRTAKVVQDNYPDWKLHSWASVTDEEFKTLFPGVWKSGDSNGYVVDDSQEWDDDPRR